MALDAGELIHFAAGLVNLTGSVLLLALALTSHWRGALAVYALGLMLTGSSFVLIAFRNALGIDDWILTNGLLITGMLVLWWSVFPLFGRKPPSVALSLLALAAIGVLWWWDSDPDLARLRNVVVVLCVLLSTFGRAWLAWRHCTPVDCLPARIMAALLVTNGISSQGVILSALGLIPLRPAAFALVGAILSVLVLVSLLVVLQRRNTARLQHLADTDALTGALNRRAFYRRARQAPEGTALMLFDFDLFKDINDRHGHLAGDRVLQAVVPALHAAAGPEVTVARFGGEEFVLLLPHAPGAADAESLRRAVGDAASAALGAQVSVSAGVVELHHDSIEQSLAAADRALYQAKAAGRNCSVWAAPATHTDVPLEDRMFHGRGIS